MNSTAIKKIKSALIFLLISIFPLLLCACGDETAKETDLINVSIVDSVFFTSKANCAEIEYGGDAEFVLNMRMGFIFESCNYPNYEVEEERGVCTLRLKNVTAPARVTVVADSVQRAINTNPDFSCEITYILNDGTSAVRNVNYTLSYHIRPNTLSGKGLVRKGYTLLGWNTKSDGSGEHIGLGSRVTVPEGENLTLYGNWVKWIDEDDFVARRLPDGTVQITGYRGAGNIQPFVIPGMIDGLPVSVISNSLTTNMRCGNLTSKTVVLPATVIIVEDKAFLNSSFTEIYFFDNLQDFGTYAFPNALSTYHVNAQTPPRLQKENYNVRFADNLDRIILNKDKKKLIFFSGCSLCYGLDSAMVERALNGEYVVVNAGLNGEFNALFQMESMLPYINEDDIFVHAPEQMNPYQFLAAKKVDSRVFCMVEGNYDLLALADFSYNSRIFEAYTFYVELRTEQSECDYSDYIDIFNNYGDNVEPRKYDEATEASRDINYDDTWGYDFKLLTEANISELNSIYKQFEENGATVFFSWAPMNASATFNDDIYAAAKEFQSQLEQLFAPYGYKIISEVTDYIWQGRYFYDTDYHLNDVGVILRTDQISSDLRTSLDGDLCR